MAGLLYLLEEVNGLTVQEFMQVFGNVVEDRPGVAAHVAALRPFSGVEQLTDAALLYLDTLPLDGKRFQGGVKGDPSLGQYFCRCVCNQAIPTEQPLLLVMIVPTFADRGCNVNMITDTCLFHTGKEEVLRCHPDLAGRLSEEGKLTAESAREQHAAGLHKLTLENKRDIDQLNKRYKEKFGFPFVICARENKANAILLGLKRRLDNSKESELEEGIQEVKKICRLRICELVSQ
uniref:2-oxo-4-hydroxy-4-carboxy-5-ureidoimidazoline decarboxylase n=1 Tax=Timema genevievae TaxID=629358 RepID=A0A7R9PLT7_TIMGE|nr:unnamed protein product [Timema genevievae]